MPNRQLQHLVACLALIQFLMVWSVLPAVSASSKPNIVLLISDDHRWDALGIAGNNKIKTPNLDRMAKEGQWYRHFTIRDVRTGTSQVGL